MSSHHPLSHPHSFVLRAVPTADSIRRCIRNDALSYVRQTILREGGQQISATSGDVAAAGAGELMTEESACRRNAPVATTVCQRQE